jgi:hypothetical protein
LPARQSTVSHMAQTVHSSYRGNYTVSLASSSLADESPCQQALYEIMTTDIIPHFNPESERSGLKTAAAQWRFPYWDWARQKTMGGLYDMPDVCKQQIVRLTWPKAVDISNPLYRFQMKDKTPMGNRRQLGTSAIVVFDHQAQVNVLGYPASN